MKKKNPHFFISLITISWNQSSLSITVSHCLNKKRKPSQLPLYVTFRFVVRLRDEKKNVRKIYTIKDKFGILIKCKIYSGRNLFFFFLRGRNLFFLTNINSYYFIHRKICNT